MQERYYNYYKYYIVYEKMQVKAVKDRIYHHDEAGCEVSRAAQESMTHDCAGDAADSPQKHASFHIFHAAGHAMAGSGRHGSELHDMTDGPIARQLLLFTLPILLSQLLQQLYTAADTALLGRLVGADALAATGTGSLLLSVIINFYIGMSAGISVVISHIFGHKDYDRLKSCITTVMFGSILVGLGFTAIGIAGAPAFLRYLQTPEDILPQAKTYLNICFLGLIAQLVYNVGTAILRALGDTKTALYYLLAASTCNFIGDVILLWVFPMGIAGAAAATVLSQYLSAALVFRRLRRMDSAFSLSLSPGQFRLSHMAEAMRKGIPAGMQALFMSISSLVIQTCINSFGYSAMAGMTVYARVEGFLYFPLFAFGIALTSFIGQNMGAERYDRVREGRVISLKLAVFGSLAVGLLMLGLSPFLLRLFTDDAAVIANGWQAVYLTFPLYWIYALNQVYIGIIRGMGKTVYPMLTSLCSYAIFRVLWCRCWDLVCHSMVVVYTSYDASWLVMTAMLLLGYRYYAARLMPQAEIRT